MPTSTSSPIAYPVHIASPSGLQVQVNANGSIRRMDYRDILLNLFLGNEVEGGPTNIYLRRHGIAIEAVPILGPRSPAVFSLDPQGPTARGEWNGVRFTASLRLAASTPAWFWHVILENAGHAAVTVDLIYAQDMALAHYGLVRPNEYYISQYVDHTPLAHPTRGVVLAVRQNLPHELLFADGRSRKQPYLTIVTGKSSSVSFRLTGGLIPTADTRGTVADLTAEQGKAERFWHDMTGVLMLLPPVRSPLAGGVARLQEILPWFTHNAMIHYLAPRGLEQYSGGGWGTRDVTQGPVELLLALGRWEPSRDLLRRVYRAQNPDGGWPQWFTFFDRERQIRPGDSHGDIVCWPVLALAEYLLASEDASLLDEVVPFFHPEGYDHAEQTTLWGHVQRALAVMTARVIPGTHLAAYGHGDWNDSLQPADFAMRERLCSAWTVTLHYQTLTTVARALRRVGRPEPAAAFEAAAARVREDFQRLLIIDETLAGFAYVHPNGRIEYWLHPRDGNTGIHYRLLPMIHAIINDLLTPEQAATHIGYIKRYLLRPDGARLFNRPPPYRDGPQQYFQRAESSTFFGREIGLMYMHAHLRYAQAIAHYGDVEAFFLALCQANPIGIRSVVPAAALRQANCYYSSSDAAFADRYEAMVHYDRVKTGEVALEGGWRIYSSGAGIAMRLIHQGFLGLRRGRSALIIDPVIPEALNGLQAEVELTGKTVHITYRIGNAGYGPTDVTLNGQELSFTREANPYRTGGAEVPMTAALERLTVGTNELVICLR